MPDDEYESTNRAVRHALEGQFERQKPWAEANIDLLAAQLRTLNANVAGLNLVGLLILAVTIAIAVKVWFF